MIPTAGIQAVGRTLSLYLGSHIAVGIGGQAPALGDQNLQFEIWRGEITARAFDPSTRKLHFKTTIPAALDFTVVETALIASDANEIYSSLISTADADSETWAGGTWTGTGVRMGAAGINLAAATATMTGVQANLAAFGARDYIEMAYYSPVGGGTGTLTLYTTDTSYYRGTFTVVAGYNVVRFQVQSLTATSNPDLANIDKITLTHAGAGSVTLDAIRAVRSEVNSTLVQRSVITPIAKRVGVPMDVEVSLDV